MACYDLVWLAFVCLGLRWLVQAWFCSIWLIFCFAAFDCRGFGLLSISLALYRGCRTCGHPSPTELAVVTAVAIASLSSCRHFQGNFMSGEEAETPFRNSILGQICGRSPISLAADRRHHRYTMPVRYTQSTPRARNVLQHVAKSNFKASRSVCREVIRKKGAASRS